MGKNNQGNQGSMVRYADYDDEDAAKDREEYDNDSGRSTFLRLEEGKTKMRFMPPLVRDDGTKPSWRRVTHIHYVPVPGQENNAPVVCARLEARQECPVCAAQAGMGRRADELERSGKVGAAKRERDAAYQIRPQRRCFANVIDRDHEEDGPKVVGFGRMIEDQLIAILEDREDGGKFMHPVQGFDIKIERTGQKLATRYKVTKSTVCPLSEDGKQANEWLKAQHNLDKFARVLSKEEITAVLNGEKLEDEDKPRRQNGKPPQQRARSVEDDVVDAEIVADDEPSDEDEEIEIED